MKQLKFFEFFKNILRGGVAFIVLTFSSSAQADDFNWNNQNGGVFQNSLNWNPTGIPGANDKAIFNLPNVYTVNFSGNVVNDFLFVNNGNVTFNLGDNNYSTDFDLRVIDNSNLQLLNGTVSSGTINIRNDVGTTTQAIVGLGATLTSNAVGGVGIDVGPVGQGTLDVINGGTVSAPNSQIRIGDSLTGIGTVNVTGSSSSLTTGTDLLVAINGQATLNVTDGGSAAGNNVFIGNTGFGFTGIGEVLVSGIGSTLTSNDVLGVAEGSQLDIFNGGQLVNVGNANLFDANIRVDGINSNWNSQGFLNADNSNIDVLNGAQVATDGSASLGSSIVTIDGSGSSWISQGNIVMQSFEQNGSFKIENGAQAQSNFFAITGDLETGGLTTILDVVSGASLINSGTASVFDAMATVNGIGSSWNANTLQIGVDVPPSLGLDLTGHVFVENEAKVAIVDTLSVVGSSTFNLNGGTANIGAGSAPITPDTLRVGSGGNLEGTGIINGNVLNDGGIVAPGLSPGRLAIGGNYTQNANGTLVLEIGGTGVGEYDQLAVSGDVFLDGTLELVFIDDFLPQTGDIFSDLFTGLNIFGDFADVSIFGLAPGWEYELSGENGSVSLLSLSDAQSPNPVPEPSGILGLGILALGGATSTLKHKLKR